MKQCLIVLFLMSPVLVFSQSIREDFHHQKLDEERLEFILEKEYGADNLVDAYKALCTSMLAEHAFLPTTKLSYFNKGKEQLEQAIKKDSLNPELRYLRLLIQLNAPGFLNYNENVSEDLSLFLRKKGQIEAEWLSKFLDSLLVTKHLEEDDKKNLLAVKENVQ